MSNLKYIVPLGVIAALLLISKTEVVQDMITEAEAPSDTPEEIPDPIDPSGPPILSPITPWSKFDAWFKQYGDLHGVNPQWLKAFALNESSLGANKAVALGMTDPKNPLSVSYDGKSWGLMQFLVSTANDFIPGITFDQLNDPETSINVASQYVASMVRQFPNQPIDVLLKNVVISYNQGVGNTKKGNDCTGDYYPRFMRNLKLVQTRDGVI